jgi:phosphatidylglycerophosphate synthase
MAFLADMLTFLRFLIAVALFLLGILYGEKVFRGVVLLLLAGWTTDVLDGKLARKAAGKTVLGRYDFSADLLMVVSSFIYLAVSGFISLQFAAFYLLLLITIYLLSRSKSVLMLFICPLTFLPFWLAYVHDSLAFLAACIWAFLAFYFERRRFFGVIAEFAAEFPGEYLKDTASFFEKLSKR